MSEGRPPERRRGVTRGYVGGLTAAVAILGLALVIAGWGGLAYLTGRSPVETRGVAPVAAEIIVLVAVGLLVWGLWLQALTLLRGKQGPPWAHTIVLALGAYFVWCLGGIVVGLSIGETWLSPFAVALGAAWGLCSLIFWAVLARRVYTDRPAPKWPWERRGEPGPDWVGGEDDGRSADGDRGFDDGGFGDDEDGER